MDSQMLLLFLFVSDLNQEQRDRLQNVLNLFKQRNMATSSLGQTCKKYFEQLGIDFGLAKHNVTESQIEILAKKATLDGCHQTNMIPVTTQNFLDVITKAM